MRPLYVKKSYEDGMRVLMAECGGAVVEWVQQSSNERGHSPACVWLMRFYNESGVSGAGARLLRHSLLHIRDEWSLEDAALINVEASGEKNTVWPTVGQLEGAADTLRAAGVVHSPDDVIRRAGNERLAEYYMRLGFRMKGDAQVDPDYIPMQTTADRLLRGLRAF